MAEQFLTLMADLDEESQILMRGWYDRLREAGFVGQQTLNLPFHISLASFALDKEQEAIAETKRLAKKFAPIPVHISHIGMFEGGKILFGGPDMNPPGILTHNETAFMCFLADTGDFDGRTERKQVKKEYAFMNR